MRHRRGGEPDPFDFSYADREFRQPVVSHPYDDGLLLGDLSALRDLPVGVDAVVSLRRVEPQDAPKVAEWVEVRLIDHNRAEHHPHLDFVLHDTVTTLERPRSVGRTVLLHCGSPQPHPHRRRPLRHAPPARHTRPDARRTASSPAAGRPHRRLPRRTRTVAG